jgi:hypothetical protein
MNHLKATKSSHPVMYVIKTIVAKLTQQPTVYPIKHYKKLGRLRKSPGMLA